MKKIYSKPTTKVIVMRASTIICTSQPEYPGSFGYIPSQHGDDEKMMA